MEGKMQSGAETGSVNKTTHEQFRGKKVRFINATAAMETTHTRVFVQQWEKPVIFVINKATSQPFVGQNSNRRPTEVTGISSEKKL